LLDRKPPDEEISRNKQLFSTPRKMYQNDPEKANKKYRRPSSIMYTNPKAGRLLFSSHWLFLSYPQPAVCKAKNKIKKLM
jgi:hypothetical protein